jgi:hypothetical protein
MAQGDGFLIIERILRDRGGIWLQVAQERDLPKLIGQMLLSSTASLAIYGAVVGANNGVGQALSSAIKLPLLFLATLAICLPTLYLFNLLFGAKLSMLQAVALIMVSFTVTGMLTLAFAPISLFFLISAHSYVFIKLLNVAILTLTALIGLRFLTAGMSALNAYNAALVPAPEVAPVPQPQPVPVPVGAPVPNGAAEPAQLPAQLPVQFPAGLPLPRPGQAPSPAVSRPASRTLLYVWIGLFGFVGTQLAWALRPFFGDPGQPFQVFRNLDGTFFGNLISTLGHFLSGG